MAEVEYMKGGTLLSHLPKKSTQKLSKEKVVSLSRSKSEKALFSGRTHSSNLRKKSAQKLSNDAEWRLSDYSISDDERLLSDVWKKSTQKLSKERVASPSRSKSEKALLSGITRLSDLKKKSTQTPLSSSSHKNERSLLSGTTHLSDLRKKSTQSLVSSSSHKNERAVLSGTSNRHEQEGCGSFLNEMTTWFFNNIIRKFYFLPEARSKKEEPSMDDNLFKASQEVAARKMLSGFDEMQVLGKEWEDMIQKAAVLTRKKDFLHLLSSSQPQSFRREYVDFEMLRSHFSDMNQQLRELKALLLNNNHVKHEEFQDVERSINAIKKRIKNTFRDVERSLPRENSSIWAFIPRLDDIMSSYESLTRKSLPHEDSSIWASTREEDAIMRLDESLTQKMEVGLALETSGDEMLEMAIDSAIHQVSKCIKDGIFRKIGISGRGGERVANALKDIRMILSKFEYSVVLYISVSRHDSIEEVRQNIATLTGRLRFCKTDYTSEGTLDQYLPDNFLLLVDCVDGQIDLHDLKIPDCGFLVLTTQSQKAYEIMDLDLEIRMEDHLLPWELFYKNVGPSLVNSSIAIQQKAVQLVKECHGHLHASVLLARALKGVTDIGVWEFALHQLTSESSYQQVQKEMSKAMVHVLKIIWDQMDIITKRCIKNCTHQWKWRANSLVSNWIQNGLVQTQAEGKVILQELINSFLLENLDDGFCVQMHAETKFVLEKCFIPSLLLRQGGLGLTETPKVEEWINSMEIELMDNKLSELPENPRCPFLQKLLLHNNQDLMEIPQLFFKDMLHLTDLDLSYTSIKSLPASISILKSLRTFYLRGCELLMELSPEIGALENLEEFDLEGTTIMYLPEEIGNLINLRYFKVSFCGHANRYRKIKHIDRTIPAGVLSKLNELRELIIDVNPDGKWWDADVKVILKELSSLKWLRTLELYLPSVESLQQLRWFLYPNLKRFGLIVGHLEQRIISRLPSEVEMVFKNSKKWNKCLEYINGEGLPTEITEALNHATLFFLDRHWTVKMLSEFGNENMVNLIFCLLVECNELQTIIDGDYEYPSGDDKKPVFKSLKYLGIHYMKNLHSIWQGPIDKGCLSNLRCLTLHTCPNLTTIFTPNLLDNLNRLEELIIEDCCKIKTLISQESSDLKSGCVLQSLKRMSFLDLPELISISGGLSIGLQLTSLMVYNCPKLETLYASEVSVNNYLEIKGEKEWWESLKWHESNSSSSTRPTYVELERGEDLMDQLAKNIYSHQPWMYF